VGNFSGTFYWFKGEGKGKFRPKPELLKSGKEPLRIQGHHSDPFVIDWDGDGALDLISGSSNGGVQWAKNRAGQGKPPDLGPFEWLIKPPSRPIEYGQLLSEEELTGPTTSTRVWVADVNGDGKLDVLVGDSVTLLAPAKGVSAEEFKKKFAAWQKAVWLGGGTQGSGHAIRRGANRWGVREAGVQDCTRRPATPERVGEADRHSLAARQRLRTSCE
jgi:hypothetical protein